MPTELDLIFFEKIAAIVFIISSVQSLLSAFEAEQFQLETQRNKTPSSSSASAAESKSSTQQQQPTAGASTPSFLAVDSTRLGLDSTYSAILGYAIFMIVAILRKELLERQIQSGQVKTSTLPNVLIIGGFAVAIIGAIIRVPGIQQRLAEAQRPVIL